MTETVMRPEQAARPESARIVRTASALLSVQAVSWTASLVSILLVPRFLGSANLGRLGLALTMGIVVITIAGTGINQHLVKAAARDREHTANYVAHGLAVSLTLWLINALAVCLAAYFLTSGGLTFVLIAIAVGAAAVVITGDAFQGALQANHTLGLAAIVLAAVTVVGTTINVTLLASGVPLIVYAMCLPIPSAVWALCTGVIVWRKFGARPTWRLETARGMLIGGIPLAGSALALLLYGSANVVLLSALVGAEMVGYYSFAVRLSAIPVFWPTVIQSAVFPSLSAMVFSDPEGFRRLLAQALRAVIIGTMPAAVGIAVLAPDLTRLIGGGDEFARSTPILTLAAMTLPLIGANTIVGAALVASERQRAWMVVTWIATVLKIGASVVAILIADRLWDNGGIGAEVVHLFAEGFQVLVGWRMAGAQVDSHQIGRVAWRAVVASAGMAMAVLLLRPVLGATIGPLLLIPIGAAVYCGLALQLRLFSIAELRWAAGAVRGRTVAAPATS